MWRLWSGILEALGRLRLRLFTIRRKVAVGDPRGADAEGGLRWQEFRTPEALFRVWGPLEGSPWEPFHCVPLFASLDRIQRNLIGPAREDREAVLPREVRPGASAPPWALPGTFLVLDLPGPVSVELATWLITSAGVQPVCTFDHWPHPKGVLKPERILAELLRWAGTVADARGRIEGDAPPVWICDSDRLGTRQGSPGEFDNRYFLDDSVLPGPEYLRRARIQRVLYLCEPGDPNPVADLEAWFADLLAAGLPVLTLPAWFQGEPTPFVTPSLLRTPPRKGFHRSAAGGFGTEIPQPSEGGSGGG